MEISATQGSPTVAASTPERDMGTKDFFLKILVAQMQNQDPLKPQDATETSSQLAQYNMVEQQLNTNDLLEAMLANSKSDNTEMAAASSYLGHKVTADSSSFTFDGSSPVEFATDLSGEAAAAEVQIVDGFGRTVRTIHNSFLPSGNNKLTWDGKTDSGATAKPDNYIIRVAATDQNGQPVPANTSITGQVSAVRLTPEGVNIMIGDIPVNMTSIKEIQ